MCFVILMCVVSLSLNMAACDDCYIRVWDVPEGGLQDTLKEPSFKIIGVWKSNHIHTSCTYDILLSNCEYEYTV